MIRENSNSIIYLIADVESTGLLIGIDRVVEISLLVTDGVNIQRTIRKYVRVEETIVDRAIRELGSKIQFNKAKMREAGDSMQVFTEIRNIIEELIDKHSSIYLVGHHIIFDYRAISAEMNLNNIRSRFADYFQKRMIDTRELAQNASLKLESYSLDSVASAYGFQHLINEREKVGHNALLDTEITFEVFKKLYKKKSFAI